MEEKYELVMDDTIMIDGRTLYRIRALKSFSGVKAGELGGYVEGYHNLSHDGNCWIYDNAKVYDNAMAFGNARLYNTVEVYGDARVFEGAKVYGDAKVFDYAIVCGAKIFNNVIVYDNAIIFDYAVVRDDAKIHGNAILHDSSVISDNADISSNKDYLYIAGLGSRNRSTTAFKLSDGNIFVNCGCFWGLVDEFEDRVNKTHGDNLYGMEYKALIQVIKIHFGLITKENEK